MNDNYIQLLKYVTSGRCLLVSFPLKKKKHVSQVMAPTAEGYNGSCLGASAHFYRRIHVRFYFIYIIIYIKLD